MSKLLVPQAGENILLNYLTGFTAGTGTRIKAYKNNYIPVVGSLIGNFTECDFTGYTDVVTGTWVAAGPDGSGRATASAPQVAFTASGSAVGNTVYGVFITDNPATQVLWAERFDTPFVVAVSGDQVKYTPTFTFKSEF
jgi:hypothetical protein